MINKQFTFIATLLLLGGTVVVSGYAINRQAAQSDPEHENLNSYQSNQSDIIGTWRWDYAENLGMKSRSDITTYTISQDRIGNLTCVSEDVTRDWVGTMDKIVFKNGKLTITHPRPNHYYKGEMSEDKMSINGAMTHHGLNVKYTIRKVNPTTYEVE